MDESSNDDARSDQRAFETAFQRLVADNDLAVFTDNEVSQAIRFRDAPHHQSYINLDSGDLCVDVGDGSTLISRLSDGALVRRWPNWPPTNPLPRRTGRRHRIEGSPRSGPFPTRAIKDGPKPRRLIERKTRARQSRRTHRSARSCSGSVGTQCHGLQAPRKARRTFRNRLSRRAWSPGPHRGRACRRRKTGLCQGRHREPRSDAPGGPGARRRAPLG
jgi:hypothetical protein